MPKSAFDLETAIDQLKYIAEESAISNAVEMMTRDTHFISTKVSIQKL